MAQQIPARTDKRNVIHQQKSESQDTCAAAKNSVENCAYSMLE